MKKRIFIAAASLVVLLGMATAGLAKEGPYLGLGPVYNVIKGDFDGGAGFPTIDSATGIGVLFGYRFYRAPEWAVELGYVTSKHETDLAGIRRDARYHIVSLDLKYLFFIDHQVQPYLSAGAAFHELVIKGGATLPGETGNAEFDDVGLNLAVGLDHDLSTRFSFGARVTYRVVQYGTVQGVSTSHLPQGNGFGAMLNLAYHF